MTSQILTVYDGIVDLIEATLSTYKRLANPYSVDSNTYIRMEEAFGLAISGGTNTERFVGCLVTWERTFIIVLVRKITTTQNNIGSREVLEKQILDDAEKLFKAFELNSTLSGTAIKAIVSGDGGVAFVDADLQKFFQLELTLDVEYLQGINS